MDPIGPPATSTSSALNMKPAGAAAGPGRDDNPQDPDDVQEDKDAP
jgi:hypothetical protein